MHEHAAKKARAKAVARTTAGARAKAGARATAITLPGSPAGAKVCKLEHTTCKGMVHSLGVCCKCLVHLCIDLSQQLAPWAAIAMFLAQSCRGEPRQEEGELLGLHTMSKNLGR
eukprot:6476223-Amphidinium_carterae.2